MEYDVFKYQALGNDYIVIEPGTDWFDTSEEVIRTVCDRHTGIGSDGILYGPEWNNGIPVLRIFNPDGSEAEKSGNGLRIFASHLFKRGHLKTDNFHIQTSAGLSEVWILDDKGERIKINMGKASFRPEDIPMKAAGAFVDKAITVDSGTYHFTCLSVGNPHAVFFPKVWDEQLIKKAGPEIEHHKLFPKRSNVQMARVIDANQLEIRIWERGAGYTMASGSSSCAAAMAAYKLGLTESIVKVGMPGGTLEIEILDTGEILMTGTAKAVFFGLRMA